MCVYQYHKALSKAKISERRSDEIMFEEHFAPLSDKFKKRIK